MKKKNSYAQKRRGEKSYIADFIKDISPVFESYNAWLGELADRVRRQLQLEAEDCISECKNKLAVPHIEISSRVKSLNSTLRKWRGIAEKIEGLSAEELKESDVLDKIFSRPLLSSLETETAKAFLLLIAEGFIEPTRRPKDRLIALSELINSNHGYILLGLDDLVGVRIVVHNLADLQIIRPLLVKRMERIHKEEVKSIINASGAKLKSTDVPFVEQDYNTHQKTDGYRAIHMNLLCSRPLGGLDIPLPCEIQLRTQAQHLWALLSRELLYVDAAVEPSMADIDRSLVLADLLKHADKIAREIAERYGCKQDDIPQVILPYTAEVLYRKGEKCPAPTRTL